MSSISSSPLRDDKNDAVENREDSFEKNALHSPNKMTTEKEQRIAEIVEEFSTELIKSSPAPKSLTSYSLSHLPDTKPPSQESSLNKSHVSKKETTVDKTLVAESGDGKQKMVNLVQHVESSARAALKQLNESLQDAVSRNQSSTCRHLIAMQADPNAKNEQGQTALDIGITQKAWSACKALIDNGATLTSKNHEQINSYLNSCGLGGSDKELFMLPCLNPYIPEVFLDNRFQKLSEVASALNLDSAQGIILFNIADETPGPAYGMVMGAFRPGASIDRYARLAEKLIVIRVRVDDVNELGNTIRNLRTFVPERIPLTNWVLMGHANENSVEVGPNSQLNDKNEEAMREVGSLIDPKAFIMLSGCCSAKGDENISKIFSRNVPKALVFGAPDDVGGSGYYPLLSHTVRIFPTYVTKSKGRFLDELKAYRNGKLVIEEVRSMTEEPISKSPAFHTTIQNEMFP